MPEGLAQVPRAGRLSLGGLLQRRWLHRGGGGLAGHHHDEIGFKPFKGGQETGVFEVLGLQDLESFFKGSVLEGGKLHLPSPSGRLIRCGNHSDNFLPVTQEGIQAG